jgi:hypothetical protein
VLGNEISGRDLILFAGGLFLIVKSPLEIRDMLSGKHADRKPGMFDGYWLIILQIGLIDIVFSLDSVFTAVGLSKHIEVMIAAIVASVLVMMIVPGIGGGGVDRAVLGSRNSERLFVFCDGFLGGGGMGQHTPATAHQGLNGTDRPAQLCSASWL